MPLRLKRKTGKKSVEMIAKAARTARKRPKNSLKGSPAQTAKGQGKPDLKKQIP
jgi:hypothetical protein